MALLHTTLTVGALLAALPLQAQRPDSVTTREITPGVTYRHLVFNAGPWSVNLLEVDLRVPGLSVRVARADDRFHGREKVSGMVAQSGNDSTTVIAAINADFFNLATGENENNQLLGGEIWRALQRTAAPADSRHTIHSQFGMTAEGRPVIDRFAARITLLPARGTAIPLDAINAWPDSNALVLYTPRLALMTPSDSASRHQTTVPLRLLGRHGDTLTYRITGRARSYGASLSAGGALAAGGTSLARLAQIGDSGATFRIVASFTPDRGALRELVGGWPRLVVHGESVADSADAWEGTFPSFSVTKHPRTGIGFSRDSTTMYLITVDGRQESSSGMSLVEFAKLMQSVGVYEGLNLDGGGSTTMVVGDSVVNHPSDMEGERTVGNAILVIRRKPKP